MSMNCKMIQKLRRLVERHELTRSEYNQIVHGGSEASLGSLLFSLVILVAIVGCVWGVIQIISRNNERRDYQSLIDRSLTDSACEIVYNDKSIYDRAGNVIGVNTNYIDFSFGNIEKNSFPSYFDIDIPANTIVSNMRFWDEDKARRFRMVLKNNRYADVMFIPGVRRLVYVRTNKEVEIPTSEIVAFRKVGGDGVVDQDVCDLTDDEALALYCRYCSAALETEFGIEQILSWIPIFNRYHPFKSAGCWLVVVLIWYGIKRFCNRCGSKEDA